MHLAIFILEEMPGIFISYRRDDSGGYAGRIFDRLVAVFGQDYIFFDVDDISPGVVFTRTIEERLSRSDTVIAVIGRSWLTASNDTGKRRIDDPSDFVRKEIELALALNLTVIPLLIDGATMPRGGDLPSNISKLAEAQAMEVSASRFDYDMNQLAQVLERFTAWNPLKAEVRRRAGKKIGIFILCILAAESVCLYSLHSARNWDDKFLLTWLSIIICGFLLLFGGVFAIGSWKLKHLAGSQRSWRSFVIYLWKGR